MQRGAVSGRVRGSHGGGSVPRGHLPRWSTLALSLGALALVASACSSSSPAAAKKKQTKPTSSSTTAPTTTVGGAGATTTIGAPSNATTATTAASGAHTATTKPVAPSACSTSGGTLGTACDTQSPSFKLAGAGANSIQPFFTRVFYYYSQANKAVSVNYSPAGSSVGVTDIEQNTVNFGDSEIPIKAPATGTAGNILQVPVDLGGVALSYNIPGVAGGLKLDGPTLAGIYLGTIKTWNNSAIAALNPGVSLPSTSIVAVHRADSSGPGYDLDQYLIDTGGSAWTGSAAGTAASTKWPITSVGVGEQLNTGVAGFIQQTPGAIGYVEYAYSLQAGFTNAALKNSAGSFVKPTQSSIGAAGAQASNLSSSNFNIINGPGASTYPLANFSWALIYQKQSNTNLGVVLGKLLDWVTTTGQQQAAALGYSSLPANVVAVAHQTLLQLQNASGQALFS